MNLTGNSNNEKSVLIPQADITHSDSAFTIDIVMNEAEFDALKMEWNHLVDQANIRIYQTFFWLRTWWKHFGQYADLHIVLIRNNGRLVGVAPLYLEKYSYLKIYKYRYLRMIGSTIPQKSVHMSFYKYGMSDYLDFIVQPDFEQKVADLFIKHLQSDQCSFDIAVLLDAPTGSFIARFLVPKLKENNVRISVRRSEQCPYIELPDQPDKFLKSLDSSTRYKIRRSDRAVTEKKLIRIYDESSLEKIPIVLKDLIRLHQQRWHNKNEPGVFADPRYSSFLFDVSQEAAKYDYLWLITAYHGSDCIAINCNFEFKGRIYDYVKAFDDQHEMSTYRPGMAILYAIIKRAIDQQIPVVDLLRGDESYKMKLTDKADTNWNIIWMDRSGSHFVKRGFHRIDTFLYVKSRLFKIVLYLFKTGWKERDTTRARYTLNFSQFILDSVTTKLLERLNFKSVKK